ncbi:MAG: hypothetical protein US69_C0004G0030 [candidate division TM6 bacterium GW2011_GWF2_38_10]|nr:MAG: hypothetical protein US69_C0004G0030 [candidate division TM6 bacterium GW2011_GWF2_38_10]
MINEIIFFFHLVGIIVLTGAALWLGELALGALLCLLGVLSNVFVAKQIMLFGWAVTCSDVYAVGCIFCLNLIQEFFGRVQARRVIITSFFCLAVFLFMSQMHLVYVPNQFDVTHAHYAMIFGIMPRITLASLMSYVSVQYFDTFVFSLLSGWFCGRFFGLRMVISLIVSQLLDTVLFSVMGLYGIVASIGHVIIVSLAIKLIIIFCSAPLICFVKSLYARK